MDLTKFLTTVQAARRLGVSPGRVKQLYVSGRLNSILIAGRRLIDPQSVAAYAATDRKAGRPPKAG